MQPRPKKPSVPTLQARPLQSPSGPPSGARRGWPGLSQRTVSTIRHSRRRRYFFVGMGELSSDLSRGFDLRQLLWETSGPGIRNDSSANPQTPTRRRERCPKASSGCDRVLRSGNTQSPKSHSNCRSPTSPSAGSAILQGCGAKSNGRSLSEGPVHIGRYCARSSESRDCAEK